MATYALVVIGMAVFQRRLLYFPDRRLTHPAEAGMNGVEELRVKTDDGETLVAWHLPPRNGHPLILYFHGTCLPRAGRGFSQCPTVAMVARPDRRRKRV